MNDMWSGLRGGYDPAIKQQTFQETVVKRLLRAAGVTVAVAKEKAIAMENTGSTSIGFDWFAEKYPAFPMLLLAQKIPYTHQTMIADLYGKNRFKSLPWWKEYEKQVEHNGYDLRTVSVAMMFNLPGAKDASIMVLHNQPAQLGVRIAPELRYDSVWPRTTFPIGKTGVVAVLEALGGFMDTVGTEWAHA